MNLITSQTLTFTFSRMLPKKKETDFDIVVLMKLFLEKPNLHYRDSVPHS